MPIHSNIIDTYIIWAMADTLKFSVYGKDGDYGGNASQGNTSISEEIYGKVGNYPA
jgi:hypothetical protein